MNSKELERLQDLDDAFNSLKLTHGHFGAEVIIALQTAKNTVEKQLHNEMKKKQEK